MNNTSFSFFFRLLSLGIPTADNLLPSITSSLASLRVLLRYIHEFLSCLPLILLPGSSIFNILLSNIPPLHMSKPSQSPLLLLHSCPSFSLTAYKHAFPPSPTLLYLFSSSALSTGPLLVNCIGFSHRQPRLQVCSMKSSFLFHFCTSFIPNALPICTSLNLA